MKSIQTISLEEIDFSDETFSINFRPNLQGLRSSIEKIGLIQPILLRRRSGGYQIVCGFRRLCILRELSWSQVPAIVVGEERDDLQLFEISIQENLTTRGFNPIEKAMVIDKLIRKFRVEPSEVIQSYLPLLSLEPNEKILNTYLSLAQMEEEVKEYILKEEVSRTNIRKLSTFSGEDRKMLIPFLSSLKLGENRFREILNLLDEIARRDRRSIGEIVQRSELQTILSREELTPSQKTDRVKKILLELRYPRLTELERTFEERMKNLNLPPNISLFHSPFFEGKEWRIELRFETLEQYRSALSFLSQLAEERKFEEFIKEGFRGKS